MHSIKFHFIYLFILFLLFSSPKICAQTIHKFEHINLPSEVLDRKTNTILEGSKGFMWFGFENGLVIYDGYKGKIVNAVLEDGNIQSFGPVNDLIEDANGKIWVGTQRGVYIYDPIKETSVYLNDPNINTKVCRSLSTTSKGEILISTHDGLLIYNLDGVLLEQYIHQQSIENSLSHNVVRCTYEDENGNIWIGTYDELNLLDRKNKKLSHFKLQRSDSLYSSNNLILSIKPFNKKNDSVLLVGTETGLCIFNTISKEFTQYSHSESANSISNSVVKTICKVDNQLWLGTDLGLSVFDYDRNIFSNHYHDFNNSYSISNNVIWDLYFDSQRNLWIASDDGVDKVYLSSNNGLLNKFSKNATSFKEGISINNFSNQSNGNIWMATKQGAFKFDDNNNSYKQYLPPKILHNKVRDILVEENGLVWIATTGGLNIYDSKNKKFLKYVSKLKGENVLTSNYLTAIAQDTKGTIWIGTFNKGLFKVVKTNNGGLEFVNFKHDTNNDNSLSSNAINDLAFDENDNVWIATDKGVNCFYRLNGVFERFTDRNVFGATPNQHISHLFLDEERLLWISSTTGLYQWNSESKKFNYFNNFPTNVSSSVSLNSIVYFSAHNKFFYFNKKSNELIRVPNNEIGLKNIKGIKLMTDETILLSGKTGFASLNVNELNIKKDITSITWTSFSISNTEIKPYSEYNSRAILNKNIDATDTITLEYNENSFQVGFTSLSFNSQKDVEYQYILENYENEWSILNDGLNSVSYTQVRPGKYNLKVKASNNQGLFNSKERVLSIIVKPPIYFSWWAILIYLTFFVLLILYYRYILLNRERDRNELKFEKLEHQKSEELIELKTRFFTNITHELKTPLTLISSPIDDLLTKQLDESTLKSLSLVKRNTDRLKKLVHQILDIRKIEAGGEKLRIQKYDINKFCKQIANQFKDEAIKRDIFLQVSVATEPILLWFDFGKVEKIVFNLLSNAFKFTPNNGTIKVSIDRESSLNNESNNDYVYITVSDTGRGISKEDQKNIFDRFRSVSTSNYTNQKGTGIGLSLIYEYATLHKGTVEFESVLNVGSKFTFSLPMDKSVLEDYDVVESLNDENQEEEFEEVETLEDEHEAFIDEKLKGEVLLKALIVEDDADMREFLTAGLSTIYKVVEAEDGQEGFKLAIKELPDIIVSDLMMPNVDGVEFCKKLKADIRTSHIPFILLTAKGGVESKITGIETGVDDYIQKPFNLEHLLARTKSLINQRESLRKTFFNQQKLEPSEVTVNSLDEKFLDDLLNKIEMEMDNSELSVKLLSEILGISSTNLYRKIKALTGQTATEFIRNIRLKRAAQLLKNEHLNVSEVMYMVGFTHPSYFTRCFKEIYGVSPKLYGK